MSAIETRLKTHGHEVPSAPAAVGNYVPVLRTGNLVLTSGQLPDARLEGIYRKRLGNSIQFEYEFLDSIPREKSGKYRMVKAYRMEKGN